MLRSCQKRVKKIGAGTFDCVMRIVFYFIPNFVFFFF